MRASGSNRVRWTRIRPMLGSGPWAGNEAMRACLFAFRAWRPRSREAVRPASPQPSRAAPARLGSAFGQVASVAASSTVARNSRCSVSRCGVTGPEKRTCVSSAITSVGKVSTSSSPTRSASSSMSTQCQWARTPARLNSAANDCSIGRYSSHRRHQAAHRHAMWTVAISPAPRPPQAGLRPTGREGALAGPMGQRRSEATSAAAGIRSDRGERALPGRRAGRPDVFDADRQPHQRVADAERRARVSAGIVAWVMIAGCSIRLSTPPRLSASAKISHRFEEAPRAGEVGLQVDRDHAAEAVHLALAPARAAGATRRPG